METGNKVRLADYVASYLFNKGLDVVSMVCAGSAAILNDAFYKNSKFQIIHSFRESNCAYHAIGYSKYTRKTGLINIAGGVCAAIVAPQVMIAQLDKVPLLVISGSVALNQNIYYLKQKHNIKNKSYQGIQDGNNIDLFKSITKYCVQVQDSADIRYELENCLHYCQEGIPGPTFLEIPGDIQGEMINPEELTNVKFGLDSNIGKNFKNFLEEWEINSFRAQIEELKELINKSKKPIILAGNGIATSNTRKELANFAEKYQIPIVFTFLACDLVEYENLFYISTIGIKGGSRAGNWALNQADLVIVLGSSLPHGVVGYNKDLFCSKAKLVVVDKNIDEHKIWTDRISLNINYDLKRFFENILK